MQNILITGSHGYIGSVICPELSELGYSVYGLDNGYFIDCLVKEIENEQPFTKKHMDNISADDLNEMDAVIHLAGLQNDPLKTTLPGHVYDIEYEYTKKLAEICKDAGIRFIYASSCSVYGTGGEEALTEDSETHPLTPYSENKLRTEQLLLSYADGDFNPVILRFATVFGYSPRMRFDLYINMFAGMALTEKVIRLNSDGTAWRPNLYIGDIPLVISNLMRYENEEPLLLNVGNQDSNVRVIDVVQMIQDIDGDVRVEFMKSKNNSIYSDQYVTSKKDKRSYHVDFSKLNQLFRKDICSTSVKEGIKILIRAIKDIKDLDSKIKDPRFFRLQWTQKLISSNEIDEYFKWR